jgi:membrane protein required for colicin V production
MGGLPINGLDLIFGALLLFFLVRGIVRGFLREVASILGIIFGFVAANKFYGLVQPMTGRFISNPEYALVAAYLIVLFSVVLVVYLITAILRNIFDLTLLGKLDRFAGGAMGTVKGGILCAIILIVLTTFLSPGSDILIESKLAPYVNKLTGTLSTLLPTTMKKSFQERGQAAMEVWDKDWAEEMRKKSKDKGPKIE